MTDRPQAEHLDTSRYLRFHTDVYLPANVIQGALAFLPDPGVELKLSRHYMELRGVRGLPSHIYMPKDYEIVDVTIVRETWAVFRTCLCFPYSHGRYNLALVVEGDYEVAAAYRWSRSKPKLLDPTGYESTPEYEGGEDDVRT